jgi:Uma2 family endonuclease
MPEPPRDPFITMTPDRVCEALSPATARFDRTRKLPLYARLGLPHLWLLDPNLETLETYRLQSGHWVLLATHAGDECVRAEPFDDIEIDLKRLWGR